MRQHTLLLESLPDEPDEHLRLLSPQAQHAVRELMAALIVQVHQAKEFEHDQPIEQQ